MFNNIGSKIKTLAKVLMGLGIVGFIITGIALMATNEDLIGVGLLIMILGPLYSWISSLIIYGFGELIENSSIIVKNTNHITEQHEKNITEEKLNTLKKWKEEGLITEEEYNNKRSKI